MAVLKYSFLLFSFTFLLALTIRIENLHGAEKRPLSREEIEKLESLRDLTDKLDNLEKAADRLIRKKYVDCLKAFGAPGFCECLRDQLPVIVSFVRYVQIVTSTREELGYSKLDGDSRLMIDTTLKARESCVSRAR